MDRVPPPRAHARQPPAVARPWQSGDHVGEWVLHSRLGRGGFAEVWLAHARTGGSPVALKIFTRESTHPSTCSRREYLIQRELLLAVPANALQTPWVLEHLLVQGKGVIVMEYYPLKWRNVYLRRDGGGNAAEAVDSLLQLVGGLAHLHQAGYLHRDLKPDNLVLSQDRRRLCLVDYGLASRRHSPPATASTPLPPLDGAHSQWGTCIVGTWTYMSPRAHVAEASHPVDDLWSVGYMLAEVLAGARLPWAGPRQHRKHSKNQYVLRSKQKWEQELTGPVADYLAACRRWSRKPWTEQADYDELCRLVRQARPAGRGPRAAPARRKSQPPAGSRAPRGEPATR